MRCIVGIDDTDSSRGNCTTYLAYRIATDLRPEVQVLPYPRLVRLNPNIPFKTRGNAAVCLQIETRDSSLAFNELCSKLEALSDVGGGANSGLVFIEESSLASSFVPLYLDALSGVVNPQRVRRFLKERGAKTFELGNGMGLVGAASSLGFSGEFDYTFELISYRQKEFWGSKRIIDSTSVMEMDKKTFPHTFNNYDYQKKKVLIAPHGPDPVFAGVRGDSPRSVIVAFEMLEYSEPLEGHMVYITNQHTDAHLQRELGWKVYSSGWLEGTVEGVRVGAGGHVYITLDAGGSRRIAAAYEPTGDLRRAARLLRPGDRIRGYGGVRRSSSLHPTILNLEKFEVIFLGEKRNSIHRGTYISSPRANRHLTKPLIRYGQEKIDAKPWTGWRWIGPKSPRVLAESR
jgi:tRNA(Ile2)-agmatinylcytidine synthase